MKKKIVTLAVTASLAPLSFAIQSESVDTTNTLPSSTIQAEPVDTTNTLPDAKPGECYAKVLTPAQYETKMEEVLVGEEAEKIETIPAKYQLVEKKVEVEAAYTKLLAVPIEYEAVTERIELHPLHSVWLTSLRKNALPVSPAVLNAAKAGGVDLENSTPGICFKEYYQPAQYKTETKEILVREAAEDIEIIPIKNEWVEEKVLVKQASKKLVEVPAVYETQTQKVLIEPAKTIWKKGSGAVEKVDHSTGEIMCLVEVPAKYKTIKKRIVKTPATIKEIEIPAVYKTIEVHKLIAKAEQKPVGIPEEYQTISKKIKVADVSFSWQAVYDPSKPKGTPTGNQICLKEIPAEYLEITKQVVRSPATVNKEEIPAVFKTMKVHKLVAKAEERRTKIPAEHKAVTKTVKVGDERLVWRQILCQTNMTKEVVQQIQQQLTSAGFDPGSIDGKVGAGTMRAVDAYQRAKDLPRGGLTMRTLESLGVKI